MITNTGKTLIFAAVLASTFGLREARAQADPPGNPLADGQTQSGVSLQTNTELGAPADLVQAETHDIVTAGNVQGTLTSEVYIDDSNNPFGLDDLTFRYVLHITGGTVTSLENSASENWVGILTDVGQNNSFDGGSGGDFATSVARSDGTITWTWSPGLKSTTDGGVSANLIIETDATNYENGTFDINDPTHVQGYVATTPDGGATVGLLGAALVGLGALRRRLNSQH